MPSDSARAASTLFADCGVSRHATNWADQYGRRRTAREYSRRFLFRHSVTFSRPAQRGDSIEWPARYQRQRSTVSSAFLCVDALAQQKRSRAKRAQ
jgi:hypothetical protein